MCAIDALGIAAMLGKTVMISSSEPGTGAPVTVTVPAAGDERCGSPAPPSSSTASRRRPTGSCPPGDGAMVPPVAADTCCRAINFFTAKASAAAWAGTRPSEITGKILNQREAWQAGVTSWSAAPAIADNRGLSILIRQSSFCGMDEMNVRALIETVQERTQGDDPLILLGTAIVVAGGGGAADDLIEHYVGAARAANVSWTLIGERLGVSKQAARQKFAHRLEVSDVIGDAAETMVMAPRLSACLQAAQAAADADDSVPGTRHLLLGLLQRRRPASVLDRLGVTRDKVRQANARLFEPALTSPARTGKNAVWSVTARPNRPSPARGDWPPAVASPSSAPSTCCSASPWTQVLPPAVSWATSTSIPPASRRNSKSGSPRSSVATAGIGKARGTSRACSFCGCKDLGPLVAGLGVWICGSCAQTAIEILRAEPRGLRAG